MNFLGKCTENYLQCTEISVKFAIKINPSIYKFSSYFRNIYPRDLYLQKNGKIDFNIYSYRKLIL